jgi:hypothetical protein
MSLCSLDAVHSVVYVAVQQLAAAAAPGDAILYRADRS